MILYHLPHRDRIQVCRLMRDPTGIEAVRNQDLRRPTVDEVDVFDNACFYGPTPLQTLVELI